MATRSHWGLVEQRALVRLQVKSAAQHLRGRRCLLYRHPARFPEPVMPSTAGDVLLWLAERAEESVSMGMDRAAFYG